MMTNSSPVTPSDRSFPFVKNEYFHYLNLLSCTKSIDFISVHYQYYLTFVFIWFCHCYSNPVYGNHHHPGAGNDLRIDSNCFVSRLFRFSLSLPVLCVCRTILGIFHIFAPKLCNSELRIFVPIVIIQLICDCFLFMKHTYVCVCMVVKF